MWVIFPTLYVKFPLTEEKMINSYFLSITFQEKILSLLLFCFLVNIMSDINPYMQCFLRLKRNLSILCFYCFIRESFVNISLLLVSEYYVENLFLLCLYCFTRENFVIISLLLLSEYYVVNQFLLCLYYFT